MMVTFLKPPKKGNTLTIQGIEFKVTKTPETIIPFKMILKHKWLYVLLEKIRGYIKSISQT